MTIARRGLRRSPAEAVGEKIRATREEHGLSRRVLAELADIHENTLKKIEAGSGNPTLGVLLRIADALGVKVHDLVCR